LDISQSLWGTGIALVALLLRAEQFHAERRHSSLLGRWGQRMATGGMMKKILVLVVDDDRFFRESMSRLIRSMGYTVEIFSSAADFLASPRLAETACLITDVQMPVMTGLELYRRLIDMGHAIPTILVTASPNDVDQARALNDGAVCYLRKPVDEEHLREALKSALSLEEDS
jgi:FixJ family two-component response regulator